LRHGGGGFTGNLYQEFSLNIDPIFKGITPPDLIFLAVAWLNRLWLGHENLDFNIFLKIFLNF
jgi:hypothetical protein